MEMTTDNHNMGSERIHNKIKEDAKENGIKRMIQEEIDKELV